MRVARGHPARRGRIDRCRPLLRPPPARATSSALRAASRSPGRRCGSCARPGARCRSTAPCARASRCSSRACGPTSSPRSRCSRCAATASTRPSSSATSSCRSRRSASTSTSCRASVPSWLGPIRTAADLDQLVPLTPEHVPFVTEAVRPARPRARRHPAHRVRRRALHPRLLPRRGRALEEPREDQGAHARRPASCGTPCAPGSPRSPASSCACRRRPAPAPCSCSTPGPARCRGRTTRPARCRTPRSRSPCRRGPRRAPHPLRRGHGRAAGSHG